MKTNSDTYDVEWIDDDTGDEKYCILNVYVEHHNEVRESFNCAGEPEYWYVGYDCEGDEPPENLIEEYVEKTKNDC